jgi:hypothetical protein
MSTLKVNKIVNLDDNGGVEFTKGVSVGAGYTLTIVDGYIINTTGILTSTTLSVSNSMTCSGIITAVSFAGNGTALTNVPGFSKGKGTAFAILG